jgi:hypothetical protein
MMDKEELKELKDSIAYLQTLNDVLWRVVDELDALNQSNFKKYCKLLELYNKIKE